MARHSVRRQRGFTPIALLCFVLLYLPIATMVIFAFNAGTTVGTLDGLSMRWFSTAWNNERIIDATIRSLTVALIAAPVATVAATMAALATTRTAAYRGLTFKVAFINQPLMIPEIVTAVALLVVFSRIKVWTGYTGIGYLIAAHIAFCIPFAFLPIRARLQTMDLSLLWPAILAGFMLAFVVSLDDVVITEFIKSAGQETLPTYMLGQLRRAVTPEMNAISTMFLALSIVIVTLFFFLSRKKD